MVHKAKTKFQELAVYDTESLGRILVLDDVVQTTELDEYLYHECLAHVPMFAHPNPEEVLIVGGGDGGTLREVLKHPSVKRATLVDIDEGVIDASKRFLPQWNVGFSNPRARVVISDGLEFVAKSKGEYDVVIVDSTDPIGPGEVLFSESPKTFDQEGPRPGGLMAAQTRTRHCHANRVKTVSGACRPCSRPCFTGPMPTPFGRVLVIHAQHWGRPVSAGEKA